MKKLFIWLDLIATTIAMTICLVMVLCIAWSEGCETVLGCVWNAIISIGWLALLYDPWKAYFDKKMSELR